MPVVLLLHKPDDEIKKIAEELALSLPNNIAFNLSTSLQEGEEGFLKDDDIIVQCFPNESLKNKDIGIIIPVHDYPARRNNIEERQGIIIKRIQHFLKGFDRKITGFVWIWLLPTVYSEF
jgi:hypothetical protein